MALTWGEIASIVSVALALALLAERIIGRLIRGQYVTREELRAVERALNDGVMLESRMRGDLNTKLKVMEVNMQHLPTADDVAELKASLAHLSEGQAVGNVALSNTREDVAQIKRAIDRLSDELRQRG